MKMAQFKAINKEKGFSLVELMVAGFLGLLLLAGVISLFLGTRTSFRMQEQLANVQTDGRFALLFIKRFVENAGWTDGIPVTTTGTPPPPAISGVDSSSGIHDEITSSLLNMDNEVDCNGVTHTNSDVASRFFVNVNANGLGALMCEGSGGGAAQPVIENVESFQVLYGVDTDEDGVVNQYVPASQVSDFYQVIAVQIGILIATDENTNSEATAQVFDVLDQQHNYDDNRIRRLFRETIYIPNHAYPIVRNL